MTSVPPSGRVQAALQVVLLLPAEVVGVAAVPRVLIVLGVTEREAQLSCRRTARSAVPASWSRLVKMICARPKRPSLYGSSSVPSAGLTQVLRIGRAVRTLAEVERVAAGAGAHRVVVVAERAAHALFVDVVETRLELEPTDVVEEQAQAEQLAVVAGVLRDAVADAVHAVLLLQGAGERERAAGEGLGRIGRLALETEAAAAQVEFRAVARRTLGHQVHRPGQGLGRDQAGARAARDVHALQAVQADHVQAVGVGHRREDRHAVEHQGGKAARQVVQRDVAHVAHRALDLHVDAGAVRHQFGQIGGAGLFDLLSVDRIRPDDLVAQGTLLGGAGPAGDHHGGQRLRFGAGVRRCHGTGTGWRRPGAVTRLRDDVVCNSKQRKKPKRRRHGQRARSFPEQFAPPWHPNARHPGGTRDNEGPLRVRRSGSGWWNA